MAQFDPNIFLEGSRQKQASNQNLLNVFQTLSQQMQQNQQVKQAALDKQRAAATALQAKQEQDPAYILTKRFMSQGMPQEQAVLAANDAMRSTKAIDPNTWQQVETKGSLTGAYGTPQVGAEHVGGVPVPSQGQPTPQSPKEAFLERQREAESALRMREVEQTGDIQAQRKAKTEAFERAKTSERMLPLVDQMIEWNKDTISTPYAGAMQPVTRVLSEKKAKAFELMEQARLTLAAPLAKQLGTNPTDKDFQASLDQIYNANASQETRDAQLQLVRQGMMGDLDHVDFNYQVSQLAKADTSGVVTLQATDKAGYDAIPAGGKYIVDGVEYTKGGK